jgi:hypothetical protein
MGFAGKIGAGGTGGGPEIGVWRMGGWAKPADPPPIPQRKLVPALRLPCRQKGVQHFSVAVVGMLASLAVVARHAQELQILYAVVASM